MRILLKLDDIEAALSKLPGWKREGAELVKVYRFPSYLSGIEFVSCVAQEAEAQNHHPDLLVSWRKVTMRLTTHSAGGISKLDLDMAQSAEKCWKAVEKRHGEAVSEEQTAG